MTVRLIHVAVILPLLSLESAAQGLPAMQPDQNINAVMQSQRQYFTRNGTAKGSGYKQYKRWEEFVAPRVYPSGEPVNITALTWANHYRAARAPDFSSRTSSALAAGVGNGNWRSVGPMRYVRGQFGYNGGIGSIRTIALHPTEPATIFAGTPAGGLWRSQDGGNSWATLTDGLPVLGISDIAIDAVSPATIYVLTGDGNGAHTPSLGVLKSTDDGVTWQTTGLTWNRKQVRYGYRLVVHPTTPAVLLAATTLGLHRTSDAGENWRTVLQTREPFYDLLLHPSNPSIMYAASRDKVYRSNDAGETWTELSSGLPSVQGVQRIRLAVSPASPNSLYVLYGARFGFEIGLYRSDDGGNTFSQRSVSAPPPADLKNPPPLDPTKPNILGDEADGSGFRAQSYYDLAMAVSPTDIDRVHIGGINTWRSDDGGVTWVNTSHWVEEDQPNYVHADIHSLIYGGQTLYAGADGGLYRSMDAGKTWTSITTGMAITQIDKICGTPQNPNLVYFGAQDNGTNRFVLDGQAMTQVFGGDGTVCQIDPTDSNVIYLSAQNGHFRRSDDGGNSSLEITPPGAGIGAWFTPFIVSPANPDSVYACFGDVFISENRGADWSNLSLGELGNSRECRRVLVAPSEPNTIYVAKHVDRDLEGRSIPGGVFRSDDGGSTWQSIARGLPLALAAITDMAVSQTDARRAWVTFSGYGTTKVFETRDGGASWTNISRGLPALPANAIAVKNGPEHGVYIGMDVGVYYRDDTLGIWVPFMNGLPNTVVKALLIDEARQQLLAVTYGRGIWQSDIYAPCPDTHEFSASASSPVTGVTVYQARRTIRSNVSFPGSITIDVSYRAGEGILLQPGFSVAKGARFGATIERCRGGAAAMALLPMAPAPAAISGMAVSRAAPYQPPVAYAGPLDIFD